MGQLLTVAEAAAELRLSRTTVYSLVMGNQIRSIKVGKSRRLSREAIAEFVKSRETELEPAVSKTARVPSPNSF